MLSPKINSAIVHLNGEFPTPQNISGASQQTELKHLPKQRKQT